MGDRCYAKELGKKPDWLICALCALPGCTDRPKEEVVVEEYKCPACSTPLKLYCPHCDGHPPDAPVKEPECSVNIGPHLFIATFGSNIMKCECGAEEKVVHVKEPWICSHRDGCIYFEQRRCHGQYEGFCMFDEGHPPVKEPEKCPGDGRHPHTLCPECGGCHHSTCSNSTLLCSNKAGPQQWLPEEEHNEAPIVLPATGDVKDLDEEWVSCPECGKKAEKCRSGHLLCFECGWQSEGCNWKGDQVESDIDGFPVSGRSPEQEKRL